MLQELVDKGSTVLVIEHNMDLVKVADWVIDLGPGAGIDGGRLIGQGPPETIATLSTPTGLALKNTLKNKPPFPHQPAAKKQPTRSIDRHQKCPAKQFERTFRFRFPRNKITVLTRPSGSGKSSLAFETLYAEGERRYAETLSGYARQAIEQMPKPKVDEITGLSPAIAIEQKTGSLNPRSTIGTITEIYDWLRILYAHLGTAYCPESGLPIRQISKETVVERVLALPKNEKIQILAPLAATEKREFRGDDRPAEPRRIFTFAPQWNNLFGSTIRFPMKSIAKTIFSS